MKTLLCLLLLLTGCQNQPRQSVIGHRGDIYTYDAEDNQVSHTRVVLNHPMSFSVGPDGTVSSDSRTESFFSWFMKLYSLKVIDD